MAKSAQWRYNRLLCINLGRQYGQYIRKKLKGDCAFYAEK